MHLLSRVAQLGSRNRAGFPSIFQASKPLFCCKMSGIADDISHLDLEDPQQDGSKTKSAVKKLEKLREKEQRRKEVADRLVAGF